MEVGQNVLRKEGYEMLTGVACYVDDITIKVSLRQNGVGTGFIGANAILPKGHH